MINVIKEGSLNKLRNIIRFVCHNCGCIFDADDETMTSRDGITLHDGWRYAPQIAQQKGEGTYICVCPFCGKEVWK